MTSWPESSRRPAVAWGGGFPPGCTDGRARVSARSLPHRSRGSSSLYLGSLAILLVSAFWQLDTFTGEVVHEPTLKNFQTIVEVPVYRTIAIGRSRWRQQ